MNKTLIIIILSILVLVFGYLVLSNKNQVSDLKTLEYENRKYKDSVMILFYQKQKVYDKKDIHIQELEVELLTEKSKVKRSEQKLSELLKRERYAQIENKRLIEKYSNYQLDSAFMAMYPRPDSLHR